ncbi:hypothetical protein AB0M11_04015 [Streptomyces sp. NPDC051987]|uniref:hypothetical protein n=1 Tax=Streptomyces sp. NPDC051987 TaxID=3155808 RepID=UPI003424ADD1
MRNTKHAAPQPWRRRGPVPGIPSGLRVVGMPACRPSGSGAGVGTTGIHREPLPADGTAVRPDAAQQTGVRSVRP